MSTLANATIEGFVTQDPLVMKTKNGKTVCNFSLTVKHYSPSQENQVSFIDVETWEKVAEACSERIRKGKRVMVLGTIKQDRWQASDGTQRSKIKIVGNTVRYLLAQKDEESLEKISA